MSAASLPCFSVMTKKSDLTFHIVSQETWHIPHMCSDKSNVIFAAGTRTLDNRNRCDSSRGRWCSTLFVLLGGSISPPTLWACASVCTFTETKQGAVCAKEKMSQAFPGTSVTSIPLMLNQTGRYYQMWGSICPSGSEWTSPSLWYTLFQALCLGK